MKKLYGILLLVAQLMIASEQDYSRCQYEIADMTAQLSESLSMEELRQRANYLQARHLQCNQIVDQVTTNIDQIDREIKGLQYGSLDHYNKVWLYENAQKLDRSSELFAKKMEYMRVIENVQSLTVTQINQRVATMKALQCQQDTLKKYGTEYNSLYEKHSKFLSDAIALVELNEKTTSAIVMQNLARKYIAKSKVKTMQQILLQEKHRQQELVLQAKQSSIAKAMADKEKIESAFAVQQEKLRLVASSYAKATADKERKEQQRQANQERTDLEFLHKQQEAAVKKQIKKDKVAQAKIKAQAEKEAAALKELAAQAKRDEDLKFLTSQIAIAEQLKIDQIAIENNNVMSSALTTVSVIVQPLIPTYADLLADGDRLNKYHNIEVLLQEYEALIYGDVDKVDIAVLQSHINKIVALHKYLRQEGKNLSWFVSLYPATYQRISDRYKQLELELTGKSLMGLSSVRSMVGHRYNLAVLEREELKNLMKDATISKDKNKMREFLGQIQAMQKEIDSLEAQRVSCGQLYNKLAVHATMKSIQGLGGVLDIMGSPDDILDLSGVLSYEEIKQSFLLVENQIKEMIANQGSSLQVQDVTEACYKQHADQIDCLMKSTLYGLFTKLCLSDDDCATLSTQLMQTSKMFAQGITDGTKDIENLRRRFYEKFVASNVHSRKYSQAQINNVITIQMAMIHTYAHIYYDKI